MINKSKAQSSKVYHRRILSMPSSSNILLPKTKSFTPAPFRSFTPLHSNQPKFPIRKEKSSEFYCISSEISLGLTRFSKVKIPKNDSKSEFLFKVLNENAKWLKKTPKITVLPANPPKCPLERKKNLSYLRPVTSNPQTQTVFSKSLNSSYHNSFQGQSKLINSTQNEIFSSIPQKLQETKAQVSNYIAKKSNVRPRFSNLVYDPLNT